MGMEAVPTLTSMGVEDDIWLAPQMPEGALQVESPRADILRNTITGVGVLDSDPSGMDNGEGLWGDTGLFSNNGFGESMDSAPGSQLMGDRFRHIRQ
jgi:hypothetical protein